MLLAAADRSDPDHTPCRELLEAHPGPLATTELVIAETGWLIERQLGAAAEAALYESAATGEILAEPLSAADWTRIPALTVQYADQHLGGVDSSPSPSLSDSAQPASAPLTDAISASSALSTSPASSCFRNSSPRPPTASFAGLDELASLGHEPAPPHPFNHATTPATRTLPS